MRNNKTTVQAQIFKVDKKHNNFNNKAELNQNKLTQKILKQVLIIG